MEEEVDDMGGQFLKTLKLGAAPNDPFEATGPFDWDDCYVMHVFIFQSEGDNDNAAAQAVGKPVLSAADPNNPGQPMWTLQVKMVDPNPLDNNITRPLKPGKAIAVAAALIVDKGNVRVEQWGGQITLV